MSNLPGLLLLGLACVPALHAAIVGGLRVNFDTSNTNTTSVRVTVSGQTNLNSGTVNATNRVTVGRAGEAGVVTLSSTNSTYAVTQSLASDGTYTLAYGTTNMLTVLVGEDSGWTGAGTNFLADDGTFKFVAGGGGDSIWTRTNGMITAESTVADGDTAFSLTSSNNIGNSYILTATNNSALVFAVGAWGGLELYGDNSYISMDDAAGNLLTFLSPTRSSGQTPYWLDTIQAHDPGTMMLELNNFGTNVFTVAAVSGYAGGGTLVLTDDGTYKTFSAVGGGGGNAFTTGTPAAGNVAVYTGSGTTNIVPSATLTVTGTNVSIIGTLTVNSLVVTNGTRTKTLPLFRFPDSVDGTGCTYVNTNDFTAPTFMRPRFSATGATNANFATFSCLVPSDLNTAVDLTATIKVALAAGDTDASTYTLGMASVANNNSSAATAANYIVLTIPPDIGGFSGWVEGVSNVTLTGWRSAMTPGQWLFIRLQRDGSDASAAAQDLLALEITYTSTQ